MTTKTYGGYTVEQLRKWLEPGAEGEDAKIIRDLLDAVERRPGADESAPLWPPLNAGMRAVLTNESCVYGSGEAIYRALAEAAGRVVAADERPNPLQASVEAIKFALESDEGFEWLALWNEGSFDTCRKEWPEAPESCYIGADPSLPAHVAYESAKPVGKVINLRDVDGDLFTTVKWEGRAPESGTLLYEHASPVASKEAGALSNLPDRMDRAELYDHMLAVAHAAKVPQSFDVIDKQISYVAELARRDGAAGDKTGQFDIAFKRLRTMVRALAQRDASKEALTLSDEEIVAAIRVAGARDGEWKALTFDSGPYEITTPNRFTRSFVDGIVALAQRDASKAEPKS